MMNSQADIETLAEEKLREAECLLNGKFYNGAFYVAGYSVELFLKARICKLLNVPDFFLFNKLAQEVYRPFKSHNYEQLLMLAGLYTEFTAKLKSDAQFKSNCSTVFTWNEGMRYLAGKDEIEVRDFLVSIKKFLEWIKAYL